MTIRAVAEAARVSPATVSRAFNQPRLLDSQTIKRVRNAAEQLGYVPNQTARALSTGRAGNIALFVPDITNPFFAAVMRGAQARARDHGYATFLADSDETPELEDVLLTKLAAQVEGSILASSRLTAQRIQQHAAKRPLVLINRDIRHLSCLLIDTAPSYAQGVAHLAALGHRTIAYVAGPDVSWSNHQRGQAVIEAADRLGLRAVQVASSRPSYHAGYACTDDVLRSGATAALAFDDMVAQGILGALASRGLAVPADFSVIGCDGVIAETTYPPLTSVTARCAEAGERAVDLLIDTLRGAVPPTHSILLPTELVIRATTGRPVPPHHGVPTDMDYGMDVTG